MAAATVATSACTSALANEPSGLVISEIAAAGVPDDWVEVKNVSDEPIDLADFVIVDDRKDLDRARPVGATILGPGERHVRVLTDSTVGFRLAGDEEVWLFRLSDGALIDGVDWAQGASPPGGSLARRGDTGAFVTVSEDTRGRPNRE
jgi:hypothetical protein